jgi:cell division septation protein DedD
MGIPRPDFLDPAVVAPLDESAETPESAPPTTQSSAPPEPPSRGPRTRARVRYDSANEPLPVTERRKKALRGLAVLVVLAAAWLGYRFLTVNG